MLFLTMEHTLMLWICWIAACFQKLGVSPRSTHILRWKGTRTGQAARGKPEILFVNRPGFRISKMFNAFDPDLVHPAIPQVILVDQFQRFSPDRCIQFGASAILDAKICAVPLRVWESIDHGLVIDL